MEATNVSGEDIIKYNLYAVLVIPNWHIMGVRERATEDLDGPEIVDVYSLVYCIILGRNYFACLALGVLYSINKQQFNIELVIQFYQFIVCVLDHVTCKSTLPR